MFSKFFFFDFCQFKGSFQCPYFKLFMQRDHGANSAFWSLFAKNYMAAFPAFYYETKLFA